MRTVALIALLVIIGVAQCGLIRRSKVEKSNFFDDISNAFSSLFGKPANTWNSQGVHFNTTNTTNTTNHTWNNQGWRFDETAAAPTTETPAPVAETPAPVTTEKPKKKKGLKNKAKKLWKKRTNKKAPKAEKVEQANFFDDIANAFGSLFGKPTNTWNSQGVHFNTTNTTNTTNNTWNSNGWRFEETDAAPATETAAPAAETPAPVTAEKPKKKKGLKNKAKKLWGARPWKKNAKKTQKGEKVDQANFFDDIANAFGSLFGKPTNNWNSQGVHFNTTNHTNSSNTTNNTWNSNGWRFDEETPAAPKKKGFLGKVGGFFKGIWSKRPWAKKKQTETTDDSDIISGNWNSAGVTFPQPQNTWNSQGVTFPQPQQQWNSQGVTYPQPQQQWNSQGVHFQQPQYNGYRYY